MSAKPGALPLETSASPGGSAEVEAYPRELAERESVVVGRRRSAPGLEIPADAPRVGVALSGGGIRSATFALGLFQALARARLVRHIDYLSTVSGGGYFGAFLGALFGRAGTKGADAPDEVEAVLQGRERPNVLKYLRENGRYLAPAGTDDLLLGGAVLLRNWIALQAVLLTFIVFVFLALQSTVLATLVVFPTLSTSSWRLLETRASAAHVLLSPWLAPSAGVLACIAFPLGWAYWTIGRQRVPPGAWRAARGAGGHVRAALPHLLIAVAAGSYALTANPGWFMVVCSWMAMTSVLAFTVATAATVMPPVMAVAPFVLAGAGGAVWASRGPDGKPSTLGLVVSGVALVLVLAVASVSYGRPEGPEGALREADADDRARHAVSSALAVSLAATATFAMLGLVDTLGGSLYWAWAKGELPETLKFWFGGAAVLLTGAAGAGRRLAVMFSSKGDGKRLGVPAGVLARVAAAIVVLGVLTTGDFGAHTIAWGGDVPARAPEWPGADEAAGTAVLLDHPLGRVDLVLHPRCESCSQNDVASAASVGGGPPLMTWSTVVPGAIGCLAAFVVSFIFGTSRAFLNQSGHHALYSARLTRAYVGASNPVRDDEPPVSRDADGSPVPRIRRDEDSSGPAKSAATRVVAGDDIPDGVYWGWDVDEKQSSADPHLAPPHVKGGPLHLVNVTINETVDGRAKIQQADRKGLGLAVGPCGMSAGVRHHVMPGSQPRLLGPASGWAVFRLPQGSGEHPFPRERLSLGRWTGISGAAISTGIGSRTNLGLSLLAGLANIRLGYWWDPGVRRDKTVRTALGAIFWVQTYLFRELLALFPGTARRLWYLSDGGHFENLGAYELIRRRLPVIVIADAEADPDYQFEGLANLVRKARIDFGTEIEFLSEPGDFGPWQKRVGPLDRLRRGRWVRSDEGSEPRLESESKDGMSLTHASVARISYPDASTGWMLYIKPTITDDMPVDLQHYHAQHPEFPHEPTADQFFDEAQWESYRKLGEVIGRRLFCEVDRTVSSMAFSGEAPPRT